MKLSKEKRNQLILTVLATLMVVSGLWFTLIRFQQSSLGRLKEERDRRRTKLEQIKDTIKNREQIEADLIVVSNKLALKEEDMASGDWYSAMITAITKFKQPYDVEIPQFTPTLAPADSSLLPKFPYKQFTVSVQGTARYHDLGQFIADFENRFPSTRILNLELAPASAQGASDRDKLAFKMDIVALVKTSPPR